MNQSEWFYCRQEDVHDNMKKKVKNNCMCDPDKNNNGGTHMSGGRNFLFGQGELFPVASDLAY